LALARAETSAAAAFGSGPVGFGVTFFGNSAGGVARAAAAFFWAGAEGFKVSELASLGARAGAWAIEQGVSQTGQAMFPDAPGGTSKTK
jgi:hypothetical protein